MFTLNDLQLRELRTPLSGSLAYLSGCGEAGRADWLNISRSGAALRLGRYLRPGHRVELMPAADWTIGARVAWCARVPGSLQFVAGLVIDRSCPEGALRFAALGYGAQAANKNTPYSVVTSVWPSLAANAEPATRPNDFVRAV